jgi:hypothetical protein
MIEIKSGIPIPPEKTPGRPGIYPWDDLNVGQCFDVHGKKWVAIPAGQKKKGREFTTRSVTEDGKRFVRVWRTK